MKTYSELKCINITSLSKQLSTSLIFVLLLHSLIPSSVANDLILRDQFLEGVSQVPKLLQGVSVKANVTTIRKYIVSDPIAAREILKMAKEEPDTVQITKRTICLHFGDISDVGEHKHRKTDYVNVSNKNYGFSLTRPSGTEKYAINALMSTPEVVDSSLQQVVSELQNKAYFDVFSTLGFQSQPLYLLVQNPKFSLNRVSEVIHEGKRLVRIDCSLPYSPANIYFLKNAYFLCDPNCHYAVKEFGCDGPTDTGKLHIVNTFGEMCNGFPIAIKSVNIAVNTAKPSFYSETTTDVDVLTNDLSEDQFRLTHFGFPEPNIAAPWISTWMKYLLAGLACTAVAYWIRRAYAEV
jgi:hypothetical protein